MSEDEATEAWKYQLRVDLKGGVAASVRQDDAVSAAKPLIEILDRHGAALKCQYDAFAGYCAEAEEHGIDNYPLYAWTRATIENPEKKAKYLKSFSIYVNGEEVYEKGRADSLEGELQPLVGGPIVTKLAKYDTNPANNPQPPKKYRT